jgi:hypothetical protein
MKTKEEYLKAVDELLDSYDAYYFINKYSELDENTHGTQLSMLYELLKDDNMSMKALNWIKNAYDCYFKEEIKKEEDNAFNYLKKVIEKRFGDK